MTPEAIAFILNTLLAGADPSAFDALKKGGFDQRYPVTITACHRPIATADIEGQNLICGKVNVPENHANPDGNRLDLAFALFKSHSQSPAADPIVYLHGGPGGSAVDDLQFNGNNFDFLRQQRDLIMFDQRASGLSAKSTTCFDNIADRLYQLAGVEPTPDTDTPLADCFSELEATGVNVADYNTQQNAYDVRAIMSALGYPTYNAIGISYGTLLGQELLRSAPEGLRSLIIDSIDAADVPTYDTNGVPLDEAIGAVVDQCAADAACAAAFPDLEATIKSAAARLSKTPIPATPTRPAVDLITMIKMFDNRNYLGLKPGITSYIPEIVTEWNQGLSTTYDIVIGGMLTAVPTPEAMVEPYAGKIPPERMAVAYALAQQAAALKQSNAAIDTLIGQLSADTTSPAPASSLATMLDATISEAVPAIDPRTAYDMGQEYARLSGSTLTRETLTAFLQKYLPAPYYGRAAGIISLMSDVEVSAFEALSNADLAKIVDPTESNIDLAVYACQESIPFNTLEGLKAVGKTYRFPFIEDYEYQDMSGFYSFCNGVKTHPRATFHTPVASDIPVLAMSGLNDTQTDPGAAEHMKSYPLTQLQALTFPEAGHGVVLFSTCAADIANAFFNNPAVAVNDDCIASLKPKFYVPAH
ncbi:pimeloyl-ACP methyl ester carboxylesterase [Devosia sp. UYZn731]|uniref:alpha/beta fold hydrolase n=1 Tax=Devosia sp. UYZn731 TaxID=3156345 RepID=UPI0033945098